MWSEFRGVHRAIAVFSMMIVSITPDDDLKRSSCSVKAASSGPTSLIGVQMSRLRFLLRVVFNNDKTSSINERLVTWPE